MGSEGSITPLRWRLGAQGLDKAILYKGIKGV